MCGRHVYTLIIHPLFVQVGALQTELDSERVLRASNVADEGVVQYDLGIDMAYKRHWADGPHDTVTLAII